MSIHARIKEIRLQSGKSQEDFATSIELKRGNYSQIELGKQLPTLDTIKAIARIYNKTYRWIIDGEEDGKVNGNLNGNVTENLLVSNQPKVQFIPQIITVNEDNKDVITIVPQKAAAGYLNGYSDPEYIESLRTISAPGYRDGLHRAFEIKGNSMPPLHPGSYSIGRYLESFTGIRNRRVHIIISKTEGIVIKRVINRPDEERLVLISDNTNKRDHPTYTIDYEDVKEIWEWRGALINAIPDPSDLYNRLNDMESKLAILMEDFEQNKGKGAGRLNK